MKITNTSTRPAWVSGPLTAESAAMSWLAGDSTGGCTCTFCTAGARAAPDKAGAAASTSRCTMSKVRLAPSNMPGARNSWRRLRSFLRMVLW